MLLVKNKISRLIYYVFISMLKGHLNMFTIGLRFRMSAPISISKSFISMHAYMYVCMCICMHVCMFVYVYMYVCVCMYVCKYYVCVCCAT